MTRLLQDSDAEAVRALFRRIFEKDMSAEFWRWKYGHDNGCGVAVYQGENLVAHYGGIGAPVMFRGKPGTAMQITDVMVAPSARNAVREKSPFFQAGTRFLEQFIGYGNPWLLGYGFPSDRHMRLAEILGLYAPVGKICEVNWDVTGKTMPWEVRVSPVTVERFDGLRKKIDRLWEQFAGLYPEGILRVRDAEYFQRRYLAHPVNDYQVLLLTSRMLNRPLGLAVLHHQSGKSLLMDIMANGPDMALIVRSASALAYLAGNSTMQSWCSQAYQDTFNVAGADIRELPITTPANVWTPGPAPDELRDRWWLTPGDTDYL